MRFTPKITQFMLILVKAIIKSAQQALSRH